MPAFNEDAPSRETTIIPSADAHTHTVIFLHGREDFGEDLSQYFFDSKASDGRSMAEIFPSIRWVFPTAKLRYSAQRDFEFRNSSFAEALKGEEIISQWFDCWDVANPTHKRELMVPGLKESIAKIAEIIKEEAQTVPLEQIILGGISQGCATAILTLLSSRMDLGGFIGLSSWLPFQDAFENINSQCVDPDDISRQQLEDILNSSTPEENSQATSKARDMDVDAVERPLNTLCIRSFATKTPIFFAHSRDDETVPFAHGVGLQETINKQGFKVTWKEYENGGHWIHPKHGVDDMATFLHSCTGI